MLNRKLGVAGAAMLGAIAFLGTNSASAVISLEDSKGKVKYAKETLLTAEEITMDGVKYYTVDNNSGTAGEQMLDMSGKVGFNPSASVPVHVRFDLMNMIFAGGNLDDDDLLGDGDEATTARTAGGTGGDENNDSWVIFTVQDVVDDSNLVTLTPNSLGVMPDQPGAVKIRVYFELTDALAGNDDYFRMKEVTSAVSVTSGVKVTVTKGKDVADVATNFEKFVDDNNAATLAGVGLVGTINIAPAADTLDATDGEQVAAADVYLATDTTITVTGDFSDAVGQHYTSADACATARADATNDLSGTTGKGTLSVTGAAVAGAGASVCLMEAADKQIPAAPYMVTVKFAKIATANAFAAPDFMDELGRFRRNGTTFHIPYLTTHEAYNQRVVIVNRGAATTYSFGDFQAEGDAMVDAGDMAMGDLPTGQTVLRSTSIVSGVTRSAASLSVVSEPEDISAAIQQVTLGSGVVDTVYLEAEEM